MPPSDSATPPVVLIQEEIDEWHQKLKWQKELNEQTEHRLQREGIFWHDKRLDGLSDDDRMWEIIKMSFRQVAQVLASVGLVHFFEYFLQRGILGAKHLRLLTLKYVETKMPEIRDAEDRRLIVEAAAECMQDEEMRFFEARYGDIDRVMSAASMAMQDRILLMPAVADRLAYLWNRKAIESGDFEVVFTISGTLPSGTQQDGMLAFWLSLDDCLRDYNEKAIVEQALRDKGQDWKAGLKEQGYSMLANKPNFRGLALLFLPFDAARKLRQTIAAVYSDGSKPLPDPLEKILEESRTSVVTSNWLPTGTQAAMASTQVKVRIFPDGSAVVSKRDLGTAHIPGSMWSWAPDGGEVKGTFVLQPDGTLSWKDHINSGKWNLLPGGKLNITLFEANFILRLEGSRAVQEYPEFPTRAVAYLGKDVQDEEPWQQLLSLPSKTLPVPVPPTYVGMTGYSGTKSGMEVNLNFFSTVNRDPHVVGEDGFSIAKSKEWKEALAQEARYVDRATQKEAVQRVALLLAEHVADEELLTQQIRSELMSLDGRVESLSAQAGTYLAATQAWSSEDGQLHAEAIRTHVGKVKTLLTMGKEVHEVALEQASKAALKLKDSSKLFSSGEGSKQKVQSVAQKAQTVKETASAGSSQSQFLFFLIVICVSILGMLFFNRMQYYEKKHFI